MPFHHTVGSRGFAFADLRTLMARASPLRSGDQLAGIAAADARERVAAQIFDEATSALDSVNERAIQAEQQLDDFADLFLGSPHLKISLQY